ncbi:hypothetical protein SI859A1_00493 [Aurantimonas manganoxydans SI85-9A1]|uniref:Uncharacterized protein n=1 Tax=Aurantimonas manganoxydans (strain ATCC BAA-1229 / DSM 21871 / SI85-9A1) TaxID=287752 RepID=Q1YKZ9_AURMS|nr:hypothetical protein SI859A1_00493 [Aurantimonas manganoxydans SI85-9A1]
MQSCPCLASSQGSGCHTDVGCSHSGRTGLFLRLSSSDRDRATTVLCSPARSRLFDYTSLYQNAGGSLVYLEIPPGGNSIQPELLAWSAPTGWYSLKYGLPHIGGREQAAEEAQA